MLENHLPSILELFLFKNFKMLTCYMQNGVGVLKGFTCVCRYSLNERLNEVDKSTLMMALYFHPQRDEKIGVGAQDIKVLQCNTVIFCYALQCNVCFVWDRYQRCVSVAGSNRFDRPELKFGRSRFIDCLSGWDPLSLEIRWLAYYVHWNSKTLFVE